MTPSRVSKPMHPDPDPMLPYPFALSLSKGLSQPRLATCTFFYRSTEP